ncbi:MAG: twin-arginine translocation signal domain-containing protein, partial [Sphingopyxis sp.]|nr:twin-arginine translocation signal domain-containing protein [Sphingopyxis sp.]
MDNPDNGRLDRRQMLRASAMAGAGAVMLQPLPVLAKAGGLDEIRKAAEAGKEAS